MNRAVFLRIGFALATSLLAAPLPAEPRERTYAFRTTSGYYLTAENGGGANINTDRKEIGPWEKFRLVPTGTPGVFALKADNGSFVVETLASADRRNRANSPAKVGLSVTQTDQNASTGFKLVIVNPEGPVVALVTPSGKYVTAEGGGGVKARGARAISTDRTDIGDWEQFVLVDIEKIPQ